MCMKCGRFNTNGDDYIPDPIEYYKSLPQLYKDLTVVAENRFITVAKNIIKI
jgi:hypothetical protein